MPNQSEANEAPLEWSWLDLSAISVVIVSVVAEHMRRSVLLIGRYLGYFLKFKQHLWTHSLLCNML